MVTSPDTKHKPSFPNLTVCGLAKLTKLDFIGNDPVCDQPFGGPFISHKCPLELGCSLKWTFRTLADISDISETFADVGGHFWIINDICRQRGGMLKCVPFQIKGSVVWGMPNCTALKAAGLLSCLQVKIVT